jgi:hypothetical protein
MGNLEGGVVWLVICGFVGSGLGTATCFGPFQETDGWVKGLLDVWE